MPKPRPPRRRPFEKIRGRRFRTRLPGSVRRPECLLPPRPVRALRRHHRRGHTADALRREAPAHPHSGDGAQGVRRGEGHRHVLSDDLGLTIPISRKKAPTTRRIWLSWSPFQSSPQRAPVWRMCISASRSSSGSRKGIPGAGESPWRRCSALSERRWNWASPPSAARTP